MIAHATRHTSGIAGLPRLELTDVSKTFGGMPAVIDMSLAVRSTLLLAKTVPANRQ